MCCFPEQKLEEIHVILMLTSIIKMNYLGKCGDKVPDFHLINTWSSYALSIFNMRSKHTNATLLFWWFTALSRRVCREAAPSTTLGTHNNSGSNYRLNHFISNYTFFPVHQPEDLHAWKQNINKASLQIHFWELEEKYEGLRVCIIARVCVAPSCTVLERQIVLST